MKHADILIWDARNYVIIPLLYSEFCIRCMIKAVSGMATPENFQSYVESSCVPFASSVCLLDLCSAKRDCLN